MKYYIGVDLGGTNVRSLLVDEKGAIIAEVKGETDAQNGPDNVTKKIIKQIESIDYSSIGGFEKIEGIGIGVPGPVDTVNKWMIMASNLGESFAEYPICDKLQAYFSKPTFIDNDANVAGLAEALVGAGKFKATVFYITISTGIGGAIIIDGKLVSGNRGHAGEIGNIIVKSNAERINHLNPGAVENEASGTAIVRKARAVFGDKIRHAGDLFELASEGNAEAIAIKNDFVDCITTLLANVCHTIDPHCIVMGGGVMKSKDYFMDELTTMFNSKIHAGMQGHIPLLEVELEDCGAIGAAMLPMSHLK